MKQPSLTRCPVLWVSTHSLVHLDKYFVKMLKFIGLISGLIKSTVGGGHNFLEFLSEAAHSNCRGHKRPLNHTLDAPAVRDYKCRRAHWDLQESAWTRTFKDLKTSFPASHLLCCFDLSHKAGSHSDEDDEAQSLHHHHLHALPVGVWVTVATAGMDLHPAKLKTGSQFVVCVRFMFCFPYFLIFVTPGSPSCVDVFSWVSSPRSRPSSFSASCDSDWFSFCWGMQTSGRRCAAEAAITGW